ncbi:NTP transferase domain-containing protein [Halosolutus gelatinilyticus]|uniref:NTP transferase domain-containing protein n=1 Tax=Halosolutus gelatinilyticus TaxID=2931975 RepID=UPI001FF4164D|nr:NTP transferase domain-containing protein [Halosolutus gelatinilyticus]
MCGGAGTRLESSHEKPLHPIDGVPMIDRVLAALAESRAETVYAAVSPNAPETRARVDSGAAVPAPVPTIETPGDGYVDDLLTVLDRPAIEPPVLTVAADLPLLAAPVIDRALDRHGDGRDGGAYAPSLTVSVPVALKRRLGVSVDSRLEPETHLVPTGVNVVGSTDRTMTHASYDPRLAVNVNRRTDAAVAAALARGDAIDPARGGDDRCA